MFEFAVGCVDLLVVFGADGVSGLFHEEAADFVVEFVDGGVEFVSHALEEGGFFAWEEFLDVVVEVFGVGVEVAGVGVVEGGGAEAVFDVGGVGCVVDQARECLFLGVGQ